jgi:hypothetical protein
MATNQTSTATNITGPDLSIPTNNANKYFNNLYHTEFTVGPADAVIVAFFEQYTANKIAAKNLAATVLYTAMAQNLDPMTVLAEFQKLPTGQLNNYLAAFLNANRVPTSVLGIKSTAGTNPLVARTILL